MRTLQFVRDFAGPVLVGMTLFCFGMLATAWSSFATDQEVKSEVEKHRVDTNYMLRAIQIQIDIQKSETRDAGLQRSAIRRAINHTQAVEHEVANGIDRLLRMNGERGLSPSALEPPEPLDVEDHR